MESAAKTLQGLLSSYRESPFTDASGNTDDEPNVRSWTFDFSSINPFKSSNLVLAIIYSFLLFCMLGSIASARLSYCYNISIGNPDGVAFMYAILCFFLPFIYVPFYAFVLNTACSPPSRGFYGGGAKKNHRR